MPRRPGRQRPSAPVSEPTDPPAQIAAPRTPARRAAARGLPSRPTRDRARRTREGRRPGRRWGAEAACAAARRNGGRNGLLGRAASPADDDKCGRVFTFNMFLILLWSIIITMTRELFSLIPLILYLIFSRSQLPKRERERAECT